MRKNRLFALLLALLLPLGGCTPRQGGEASPPEGALEQAAREAVRVSARASASHFLNFIQYILLKKHPDAAYPPQYFSILPH